MAAQVLSEAALPETHTYRTGNAELPLRLLDGFSIVLGSDPAMQMRLTELQTLQPGTLVAQGFVPPADNSKAQGQSLRLPVKTGPITDWIIEYGANPCIWLCTERAWYKLLNPSPAYVQYHATVQRKYDLCVRATNCILADPQVSLQMAVQLGALLQPAQHSGTSRATYTLEDLKQEAGFIMQQLVAFIKKYQVAPPPMLTELKQVAAAVAAAATKREPSEPPPDEPPPPAPPTGRRGGRVSAAAGPKRKRISGDDDGLDDAPDAYEARPKSTGRKSRGGRASAAALAEEAKRPHGSDDGEGDGLGDDFDIPEPTAARRPRAPPKARARGGGRRSGAAGGPPSRSTTPGVFAAAHDPENDVAGDEDIEPDEEDDFLDSEADEDELDEDELSDVDDEGLDAEDFMGQQVEGRASYAGLSREDREELKRQRRNARWHRKKAERLAAKAARETANDVERGDPPPACQDWRVEPDMVPDVLALWEMCMTFSTMLQLPPFPLRALEAAIMPGPLPLRDIPATFIGPGADGGPPPVVYDLSTLVDEPYAASALLLRDVHAALLRMIENHAPRGPAALLQPEVAKLGADDGKAEAWQERVSNTVFVAPWDICTEEARAGAEVLRSHDYLHVSPRQRLAMLRTLMEMALASEVLRDHISARIEALAVPVKARLTTGPNGELMEEATGGPGRRAAIQPIAVSAADAESPETWVKWMDSCKLGMRKPAGTDFRKRRYWAFGGRAGAWRIFVELEEGRSWGWYEGITLMQLTEWLRRGDIEREAQLMRVLDSVPMPKKLNQGPVPEPGSVPAHLLAAATIPWTPEDMDRRRPNGYRDIVAPLLRGELNLMTPGEKGKGVAPGDRIFGCIEALVADLEFWNRPTQWAPRLAQLLDAARVMPTQGTNCSPILLEMEQLLSYGHALRPEWGTQLRDKWRASAQPSGFSLRDVALHLAALQAFVNEPDYTLARSAFMKRVSMERCPLYFPNTGDVVVVFKTGAFLHLDKHLALNRAMGNTKAVQELQAARERLAAMQHVERFRVAAIAYRSYPMPPAPEPVAVAPAATVKAEPADANAAAEEEDAENEDAAAASPKSIKVEAAVKPELADGATEPAAASPIAAASPKVASPKAAASPAASPPKGAASPKALPSPKAEASVAADAAAPPAEAAAADADAAAAPDSAAKAGADAAAAVPPADDADMADADKEADAPAADADAAPAVEAEGAPEEKMTVKKEKPDPADEEEQQEDGEEAEAGAGAAVKSEAGAAAGSDEAGGAVVKEEKPAAAVPAVPAVPLLPLLPPCRPPCMWMLLQPLRSPLVPRFELAKTEVVLPLHIDNALPDYVVKAEHYEKSRQKVWQPGDRFRMYFGGKLGTKVGGSWYKGRIESVNMPDDPANTDYDPWDSINVEWDKNDGSGQTKVSPWEIEIDPDTEKKIKEEKRRAEEAAARAQRAAAKERKQRVAQGLSDGSSEDDEDDRRRPRRRPVQHHHHHHHQEMPSRHPSNSGFTPAQLQLLQAQRAQQLQQHQQSIMRMQGGGGAPGGRPGVPGMGGGAPNSSLMAQLAQQLPNLPPLLQQQMLQRMQQQHGGPASGVLSALQQQQLRGGGGGGVLVNTMSAVQAQQQQLAHDEEFAGVPVAQDESSPPLPSRMGSRKPVSGMVMQSLPQRDPFHVMLANFIRRTRGVRVKMPTVGYQELDLHKFFMEVQSRGGYETVTMSRGWPEVSRAVGVDPALSYSARVQYERYLLSWEEYLSSGQYEQDAATGNLPPADRLVEVPAQQPKRPPDPGTFALQAGAGMGRGPALVAPGSGMGMAGTGPGGMAGGQMGPGVTSLGPGGGGLTQAQMLQLLQQQQQQTRGQDQGNGHGQALVALPPAPARTPTAMGSRHNSSPSSQLTTSCQIYRSIPPPSSPRLLPHSEGSKVALVDPRARLPAVATERSRTYRFLQPFPQQPLAIVLPKELPPAGPGGGGLGPPLSRLGRALVGAHLWRSQAAAAADDSTGFPAKEPAAAAAAKDSPVVPPAAAAGDGPAAGSAALPPKPPAGPPKSLKIRMPAKFASMKIKLPKLPGAAGSAAVGEASAKPAPAQAQPATACREPPVVGSPVAASAKVSQPAATEGAATPVAGSDAPAAIKPAAPAVWMEYEVVDFNPANGQHALTAVAAPPKAPGKTPTAAAAPAGLAPSGVPAALRRTSALGALATPLGLGFGGAATVEWVDLASVQECQLRQYSPDMEAYLAGTSERVAQLRAVLDEQWRADEFLLDQIFGATQPTSADPDSEAPPTSEGMDLDTDEYSDEGEEYGSEDAAAGGEPSGSAGEQEEDDLSVDEDIAAPDEDAAAVIPQPVSLLSLLGGSLPSPLPATAAVDGGSSFFAADAAATAPMSGGGSGFLASLLDDDDAPAVQAAGGAAAGPIDPRRVSLTSLLTDEEALEPPQQQLAEATGAAAPPANSLIAMLEEDDAALPPPPAPIGSDGSADDVAAPITAFAASAGGFTAMLASDDDDCGGYEAGDAAVAAVPQLDGQMSADVGVAALLLDEQEEVREGGDGTGSSMAHHGEGQGNGLAAAAAEGRLKSGVDVAAAATPTWGGPAAAAASCATAWLQGQQERGGAAAERFWLTVGRA